VGSLTKVLQDLSGASEEEQAQKERLELLLVAAKAKLRGYKDEINANFMNPGQVDKIQVPGHRAIRSFEQYHVATKSELNDQVKDHLDRAIDAFFSIGGKDTDTKDAVKSGITSLISMGLDGFIGSTEVGETEERIFVIVPENNAFIRADIACWKYTFEQHKIINQSDTAIAYLLCKSVVDHKQFTIDELIYFATDTLVSRAPMNGKVPELPADTKKALQDAVKGKVEAEAREALATVVSTNAKVGKDVGVGLLDLVIESGKATDVSWSPPRSLDLYQPYRNTAPDIEATEAYIDELIRVWKKVTAEE
jgi:hypothetical protein